MLAASDVSSRYSRRGRSQYERIADYLEVIIRERKGNYMVFFPSYQFQEQVEAILLERERTGSLGFDRICQSNRMTEEEREAFLEQFEAKRSRSFAALCVMGGIFSEGIDLKEERLIGAVIVGTGLPQVNTEQEILKEYFDEREGNGFDYAYQYPGMNKVLQSAGRVIRTDQDRGVITLLDDRFMDRQCQEVFPREWNDFQICNSENIEEKIAKFWKAEEQTDMK